MKDQMDREIKKIKRIQNWELHVTVEWNQTLSNPILVR
jgi:hypothetical protein